MHTFYICVAATKPIDSTSDSCKANSDKCAYTYMCKFVPSSGFQFKSNPIRGCHKVTLMNAQRSA